MNKQALSAFALTLSLCAPTLAQQTKPGENPQDDVVRITTNLVQVEVVVVDKEGRQVSDLTPADFELVEDGKQQQISNFSYVPLGGAAAGRAAPPAVPAAPPLPPLPLRPEQVRRTIALVVDDLGLSFESVRHVKEALRKFVDEQMQPGDQVAVIRTGADAGVLQQLTSDRRPLHAAIDGVRWNPAGRGGLAPFAPVVNQKETLAANEAASDNKGMADIRASGDLIERAENERADNFAVGSLGTLGFVVRGMQELPGRKAVVFISEAFRLFKKEGRNLALLQSLERLRQEASLASTAIYTVDASGVQSTELNASDKVAGFGYVFDKSSIQRMSAGSGARGGSGRGAPAPPPNTAAGTNAQAQEGSIAAFARLRALTDNRVSQQTESHSVLSFLAEETGGFLVRNTNDLGGGLRRILDDQKGYYLIGYRPEDATVDPATGRRKVRGLDVRVKRPGLKIRKGTGTFGVPFEGWHLARRTREEQVTAALMSPFAASEVDVRLTSLFGEEQAAGAYIRSLVSINPRHLSFEKGPDGTHTASMDVAAVIFGDNGRVVEQFAFTQAVSLKADEYRQALDKPLIYNFDLPLKQAGAYQLRVAVRDAATERIGTARQYVEAPDVRAGGLALSGIIIRGSAPAPAPADGGDDWQAGPALRRLRQGMFLDYRYAIYNAQPEAASGRPRVSTQIRLFRDGQAVFTGRVLPLDASQQPDVKRLGAGGRLRLGPELTPGSYVLQVVVEDTNAKEKQRTARQWIDFEIVN